MSYVNHYFNYTQMLSSIKEELPESIDFIPRQYCVMLYNKLKAKYDSLKPGEAKASLTDIHNELLRALCASDKDTAEKYNESPEFFDDNADYKKVLNYFAGVINRMPYDYKVNKEFFLAVKRFFNGFKSPVSYISRLVISRMEVLNANLLGDFAAKWDENASDNEKSRIIALLIMRQFILQFGDGTIKLPIKDGKGGFTYSDKVTYIRLSDKGKKDKNGNRIATADDYWCPAITEMCKANYGGDFEKMAENLTFDDFDTLKADRGCRLASLADQFSKVNFGVQKKGRANMYVFAIAFELTFNKPQFKETDISKCLFYDLFNNTFLTSSNEHEHDDESQGYGINFKNFVDITYLYYLSKDFDETGAEMTPALRLYRALNTIAFVKKQQKNLAKTTKAAPGGMSAQISSGIVLSDDIKKFVLTKVLCLNEDDFRQSLMDNIVCYFADPFLTCPYFPLKENYDPAKAKELLGEAVEKSVTFTKNGKEVTKDFNVFSIKQKKKLCSMHCGKCKNADERDTEAVLESCSIYNAKGWTGAHLYSYDQKTANLFYEFMNENEASAELMPFKFVAENESKKYPFGSIIFKSELAERPDVKAFSKAVKNVIDCLENENFRPEMRNDEGKAAVSRTDIFGAYCRHIAGMFRSVKNNRISNSEYQRYLKSFSAFYDFFCSDFEVEIELPGNAEEFEGINSVLIKSNFQPVSYSSLFDIVAIYITYRTCLYEIYGNINF